MKTLAIDYGERYVGLAITDDDGRISLRHSVIDQTTSDKEVVEQVAELVENEAVAHVIVGVPMGLAGDETEQTFITLQFIENLREKLGEAIEVEGVDETFTSKEAARLLETEQGNKLDVHSEAARLMLETYIQSNRGLD